MRRNRKMLIDVPEWKWESPFWGISYNRFQWENTMKTKFTLLQDIVPLPFFFEFQEIESTPSDSYNQIQTNPLQYGFNSSISGDELKAIFLPIPTLFSFWPVLLCYVEYGSNSLTVVAPFRRTPVHITCSLYYINIMLKFPIEQQ